MVRAAAAVLVLVSLAACNKPAAQKAAQAAPSAPASSAPVAAAAAAPSHHWAYKNGVDYGYISADHAAAAEGAPTPTPTVIRYLGEQDGIYNIAEVEGGALVVASCSKPCLEVRLRGAGLDQTLALSPGSVVAAALADAMAGQLEIYQPPAAAKKP